MSLPVALYTATGSHTIRFHRLQRGTADRVRNRRVNERTGGEVDLGDIVKDYDTGSEYVIVEPGELDDIAPGRSKAIEVQGFVDLDAVDPIFIGSVSGVPVDFVPDDLLERVAPLLPPVPERRRRHPGRLREPERRVGKGGPEEICATFPIARGERPAEVGVEQGFHSESLAWPVVG
ncbi:Ku protein [Streptomyces sp. MMS24-I29]|uniref:Ku protein n=1 Tax=Streptomyces sp. MMS24-I29 TaxID=3351480 RepID=UPI003C799A3B